MRSPKLKFFLGVLLSVVLVIGLFTGCSGGGGKQAAGDTDKVAETKKSQETSKGEDGKTKSSSEPVEISYWAATSPESVDVDPENMEIYKLVEKKTNVDIQWIHIPRDKEQEQFELMISTNKLPDVIFSKWSNYGPDKAMENEIIVPIDDIISQYALNLKKLLDGNPDVTLDESPDMSRDLKTDSGHYYIFPYVKGLELFDRVTSNGLQMRKDWLEDLGLEAPKTIDDWYNTLKAFRDQKDAMIPFAMSLDRLGFITSAWGFDMKKFNVKDKKIFYPPIEPEYKEALDTFRKWSDEGLLVFDPEKLDDFTKKIVSGAIGAWQHSPGMYVKEGKATDPNFDVIAVQNPVVNEGETPHIFPRWPCEGRGAAVSAQCPKDKYEAIGRWMDFAYSEEGYILDNFGIEGKQYTIVNDKIMPADIMYKEEPDGLTLDQYMRRHFRPKNAPGPYMNGGQRHYLHEDALNKDKNYPYMDQAAEAWGNGDPSGTMPLLYLTSEEAKVIDNYSGMTTYVSDMLNKFISGEESLDNFDKYVEEAKRLGADKVVSIYQSALDRYYAR